MVDKHNDTEHSSFCHNSPHKDNHYNDNQHNDNQYYEENVVTSSKSNLLLMSFCLHIINYNS
jgi:hypothetical protein